jgi:hypothetical protein
MIDLLVYRMNIRLPIVKQVDTDSGNQPSEGRNSRSFVADSRNRGLDDVVYRSISSCENKHYRIG